MHSYLNNSQQQVQINNKFSSESTVIAGVPQGSIDGPLLRNLFINGLRFFIPYRTLSNYTDVTSSVRLRTKWFWVRVQLQSLHLQISRLL